MSKPAAAARALVACLCAEWCGTCRDYREPFARLAEKFGAEADFVWIDVEDEADALGDVDVEDFPTLLIQAGGAVAFFGPVTPHPQTAERLLRNALDGVAAPVGAAGTADLAARVQAFFDATEARR